MNSIRVRVGGVYVRGEEILLVQHEKDGKEYWLLPGGGCEMGETLAGALERELREETGLETCTRQFLFSCESIPPDRHRHGLNMIFFGQILSGKAHLGESGGRLKRVEWRRRSELPHLRFYPNFKYDLLKYWSSGFRLPPKHLGNFWDE